MRPPLVSELRFPGPGEGRGQQVVGRVDDQVLRLEGVAAGLAVEDHRLVGLVAPLVEDPFERDGVPGGDRTSSASSGTPVRGADPTKVSESARETPAGCSGWSRQARVARRRPVTDEALATLLLIDQTLARLEEVAEGDDANQAAGGIGRDDGQLLDP